MATTGKTGADAIWTDIRKACKTYERYAGKFNAVVAAAESAGALTSGQAATILAFTTTLTALCTALEALAQFSGF